METQGSLLDEAIASTYDPVRRMGKMFGKESPTSVKVEILNLRKKLVGATKFVIDDSLIPAICQVSYSDPETFSKLLSSSRLPYPTLWIEWDEKVRVNWFRKIDERVQDTSHFYDEKSILPRAGFLIEKVSSIYSDTLYHCTTFVKDLEDKVLFGVMSFLYDTETGGVKSHLNEESNFLASRMEVIEGSRFPTTALGPGWVALNQAHKNKDFVDQISDQFSYALSPIYASMLSKYIKRSEGKKQDQTYLESIVSVSSKMLAGDFRWAIAFLGTLNSPKLKLDRYSSPITASRTVLGKEIKGTSYNVVKISIPHERAARDVVTGWSSAPSCHRRHHQVRGHWCYGKNTGKRWWRESHSRGKITDGEVVKEYVTVGASP